VRTHGIVIRTSFQDGYELMAAAFEAYNFAHKGDLQWKRINLNDLHEKPER
jgi:hypothetical protein